MDSDKKEEVAAEIEKLKVDVTKVLDRVNALSDLEDDDNTTYRDSCADSLDDALSFLKDIDMKEEKDPDDLDGDGVEDEGEDDDQL